MGGKKPQRKQQLRDEDMFYNVRQQFGNDAFAKVERARIVEVGIGGIGSNLGSALAGSGFRHLSFMDGDTVSRRNVPLSDVFTTRDVGQYKAKVLADLLTAKYGKRLRLKIYNVYSDKVPVESLTEPDMLFLGVDDRWTRLTITSLRVQADKPYVNLGFYGWEAAYMLVIPHKTACWACLWRPDDAEKVEKLKREGKCPEPETNVPGAVSPASIQQLVGFAAGEAVKFFTGHGKLIQYYKFNVQTGDSEKRFLDSPNRFKPDPDCPICSRGEGIDVSRIRRNS